MFTDVRDEKSMDLWLPDGARVVFISDAQIPFQDDSLLDSIFNDFVPWYKRGASNYNLALCGDIIDNYSLSRFPSRVTPLFTLEKEVEMTKGYLKKWRKKFDNAYYAFGNHEDRWQRELFLGNPKFAFATKSLEDVLELNVLGYTSVPYLKHFNFNGFVATHGDSVSQQAAAVMLRNYSASGVSGHTNRPQSFTHSDARDGEPNTWYNLGMTCRMDIGNFIPDWRRVQPWQQGFGIGEVFNGRMHFQLVRVHGDAYYAAGKVFHFERPN